MQKKIIKFIIIPLVLFIIVIFFLGLKNETIYNTKALIGDKLPKINLEHFSKDTTITEKDFKKKFVLINFWASWCSPCRTEHPFLIELAREKDIQLLGINFKDKKVNANTFLKELGNPYDDIAIDELGKYSVEFGIYGIPESILVNEELTIIKKFIGPISKEDFYSIKRIIN